MLSFTYIVLPFVISACVSLFLTVYALKTQFRSLPARSFALMTGIATFWTACHIMMLLSNDLPAKMMWIKISYIAGQYSAVALFFFAMQYTHLYQRGSRTATIALLVVGALIILAVLTNEAHHWMWREARLVDGVIKAVYGPLFWLTLIYPYCFTVASLMLLLRLYFASTGVYRKRSGLLVLGAAIPIVVSIVNDAFGVVILPGFDATVFSLVITGILFGWALFRFKALEFLPIAYSAIIEHIRDGVLVLNSQNRVVFLNPAATKMLALGEGEVLDADIAQILKTWSQPAWQQWQQQAGSFEIARCSGEQGNTYQFHNSPLREATGQMIGSLLMIYDISERKQLEQRLEALAISDPLTGCYNRRHFLHLALRELEKAQRYARPLSLIMLDIDHFKLVNDQHGHLSGDSVLKKLVEVCLKQIRQSDLFARYGGEEFVILLPEMDANMATQVAERIQRLIQDMVVLSGDTPIQVTASFGVAGGMPSAALTIDRLLSQADSALYASKEKGRNQISVYEAEG